MKTLIIGITALLVAGLCLAQTPETKPNETKFYKLDFAVKELEAGKVVNSRTYSTSVATNGKASVRTQDRVQVSGGKPGEWSYIDVGVNIDCNLMLAGPNTVSMHVTADVSGFVNPEHDRNIVQNRWSSDVVTQLRKATTLFSSDGASSKRQTQLEVTVTPIQ